MLHMKLLNTLSALVVFMVPLILAYAYVIRGDLVHTAVGFGILIASTLCLQRFLHFVWVRRDRVL